MIRPWKWLLGCWLALPLAAQTVDLRLYGAADCGRTAELRRRLDQTRLAYSFYDVEQDTAADRAMTEALERAGMGSESIHLPVLAAKGLYLNGALDRWESAVNSLKTAGRVELFTQGNHPASRKLADRLEALGLRVTWRDIRDESTKQRLFSLHQQAGLTTTIHYPVVVLGDHVFNDGLTALDQIFDLCGVRPRFGTEVEVVQPEPKIADREQTALALLEAFCPDAASLLRAAARGPRQIEAGGWRIDLGEPDALGNYLSGNTKSAVARELNTAVHEMMHDYVARMAWRALAPSVADGSEIHCLAYPLDGRDVVRVQSTPVFVTHEMHKSFPPGQRGERYALYVYPSEPDMSSQRLGAYGLLDEFCAYYWGSLASVSLFDYYQSQPLGRGVQWLDWAADAASTLAAYGEFRLYLIHYLDFACRSHPKVYRELLSNAAFVRAFRELDQRFGSLCETFDERLDTLVRLIGAQGIDARLKEDALFIGSHGRVLFREDNQEHIRASEGEAYKQVRTDLDLGAGPSLTAVQIR